MNRHAVSSALTLRFTLALGTAVLCQAMTIAGGARAQSEQEIYLQMTAAAIVSYSASVDHCVYSGALGKAVAEVDAAYSTQYGYAWDVMKEQAESTPNKLEFFNQMFANPETPPPSDCKIYGLTVGMGLATALPSVGFDSALMQEVSDLSDGGGRAREKSEEGSQPQDLNADGVGDGFMGEQPAPLLPFDGNAPAGGLTEAEIEAVRAGLYGCWYPPAAVRTSKRLTVELRIFLRTDGSLAREPELLAVSSANDPLSRSAAESAMSAVRCMRFGDVLPADRYWAWNVIDFVFDSKRMPLN